jgi:2'-5' RNA ligase
MKLFIGIDLPEEMKSKIKQTLHPLQLSSSPAGVGWERSHDYHQTLLFIGETSEEKIPEIKERMNKIVFVPFELRTNGFSFFNTRIMYVDFHPSLELNALKKKINSEFPEYIRPGEKVFVPHVTVKRWQRYEYDLLAEGIKKHRLPDLRFTVERISLFKSERDEHNLKYHVIN